MSKSKAAKFLSYTLLPGVIPRARALFTSGFGQIAFLMACVYAAVRLLPPDHPYLNSQNIGKFGIRHVIGEAANNLSFSKNNLDQILVFFTLLCGIVILFLQFALLLYGYVIQPALAQSIPQSLFKTENPTYDIAFMLLDHIFGIPNFVNSCVDQGIACNPLPNAAAPAVTATATVLPTPFHAAFHAMLRFYSTGLLIVAVIIMLYFILVIVIETAATGTPFGERFQNIWVPIRLVFALGLLVPINYGLNSGQYVALYAAKIGSGLATNGWLQFNNTLKSKMTFNENALGESKNLLGKPAPTSIAPVVQFLSVAHSCAYAHWKVEGHYNLEKRGNNWVSLNPNQTVTGQQIMARKTYPGKEDSQIKAYFVKIPIPLYNKNTDSFKEITPSTTYADALNFYDNGDIIIRFGRRAENAPQITKKNPFGVYKGQVEPTCGEIRIPIFDRAHLGQGARVGGADQIQEFHFNLIKSLWLTSSPIVSFGGGWMPTINSQAIMDVLLKSYSHQLAERALATQPDMSAALGRPDLKTNPPSQAQKQTLINAYQANFNYQVTTAWNTFNTNTQEDKMRQEILARGWGGAGLWYNKIAEMNGTFVSAVLNIPSPTAYPSIMQNILTAKMAQDKTVGGKEMFDPSLAGNTPIKEMTESDRKIAIALNDVFLNWNQEGADQSKMEKMLESNMFKSIISMIFGTSGLFDMQTANAYIHPLAQLSAVGKGLVEGTIRNLGISIAATFGGQLMNQQQFMGLGYLAGLFGGFLSTTAFIGVTAGFVLFYVLPFLPFLYFYFALASWVKTIFEAMVGTPLWALAHLRLDGEGLPGDAASNGYFLLFEIFLRPILSVIGLIAAIVIFTAQVRVLNFLWHAVVSNVTGYEVDPTTVSVLSGITINRGPVDELFYTILYVMIVYMLAMACFKLIDRIPDNILRWMGAGVSAFSDINQDNIESVTRYATLGGLSVGQKVAGSLQQLAGGAGKALDSAVNPPPKGP